MLPNFLVIGAPKAGTSSLYAYLRSHPQVFMPARKELNFFIAERAESRRGVEWYEFQFEDADRAAAVGEASPLYTVHPVHTGVPARIAELVPDVKLVYVVRDPLDRLISHYRDMYRGSHEVRPVERALRENALYIDASRYAFQIEQYLDYFPPEQILVVVSEHLRQDRGVAIERVYRFLGVNPSWQSPAFEQEHNVTQGKRMPRRITKVAMGLPGWPVLARAVPRKVKEGGRRISHGPTTPEVSLSPELEEELLDIFRPDVARLRRYVRGPFDGWGIG